MTDANYSRTSPPARTSSLLDLVHKTETHPSARHLVNSLPRQSIDSDDGSQQERNHQQPRRPISNLPRLPPPQDVSLNARHVSGDTSPKHPYRKRKLSQGAPAHIPPDLSSLTQKPEDHASSVAQQPQQERPPLNSPARPDDRAVDKFNPAGEGAEGSTEINPVQSSAPAHVENTSPGKQRRRSSIKDVPQRTELLEENRALRMELDRVKYRLRKIEGVYHKQKKDLHQRDNQLSKYRAQLIELFESGDGDLFQVNKAKYAPNADGITPATPHATAKREDTNSKIAEGESISNSQEEDWSTYSAPSHSLLYDEEKSEDVRRQRDKDPYARSEVTIRKHRRTRAPAWTPEEEIVFMQAYNKHGCRWKLFQDSLPGRSRRQIQSHGSYLIRQGKLHKKNSRPWQRRKPRAGMPSSSIKDAEVEMEDVDRSDRE